LGSGAFLIHAVKCWHRRDWPSPEAIARCARSSLSVDLVSLRPERLCLFGKIPHEAASHVFGGLPAKVVSYFDGWAGEVSIGQRHVPTLITVLPNQWNRKYTLAALRSWLSESKAGI
jgi:uracil-DNA glycosylase